MSGARGPSGSAGSYGPMKEYIVHSPENQSAQGERGAHRTSSRGPSLPYADDSRGELVARRAKRELSIDYAGDIPVPTGGLSPPGPGPSGAVDQDGDVLMAMMDVEINNATSYVQQNVQYHQTNVFAPTVGMDPGMVMSAVSQMAEQAEAVSQQRVAQATGYVAEVVRNEAERRHAEVSAEQRQGCQQEVARILAQAESAVTQGVAIANQSCEQRIQEATAVVTQARKDAQNAEARARQIEAQAMAC